MKHLSKRGETYHFNQVVGGRRLRCSLGTQDSRAASRLANRIEFALADGPKSPVWKELKFALRPLSYKALTDMAGVEVPPDLTEFEQRFLAHLDRRVRLEELAERSRELYEIAAKKFFLAMQKSVRKMDSITSEIVDQYCVGRMAEIQAKGGSGRGLILETAVLSMIFAYGIQEGVISVSPLKRRPRPDAEPRGAEPFTPAEVKAMDRVSKSPLENLIYLLFKQTGLRASDVSDLRWAAIDWYTKTLTWRTRKRGKLVTIPLLQDVYGALKSNCLEGDDKLFPGYGTNRLYKAVRRIGETAGVEKAHPHRFRDTMAVTMLSKGATIYDVAKILGDTVATIEKHYAPFTAQLQERVRGILEPGGSNE